MKFSNDKHKAIHKGKSTFLFIHLLILSIKENSSGVMVSNYLQK